MDDSKMGETSESKSLPDIDIARILRALPHRYPFLMVDRIIEVVSNESATGIKAVTASEPHFQGHFPEHPIMPGVLIIEAMAQTAAVLVVESWRHRSRGKAGLLHVDQRRAVSPSCGAR